MAPPNRRSLLAAPLLATALVATGGAAATASTPPGECWYPLKPRRAPNLGSAKLRYGSRGRYVKSLQNLLNHAPRLKSSSGNWYKPSCPLNEDGVFGSSTLSRVRGGQRALGLTADGVVGPNTKRAYYNWAG